MAQRGNKDNAVLNGEWGEHVKGHEKKITSKKRRKRDSKIIEEQQDVGKFRKKNSKQ